MCVPTQRLENSGIHPYLADGPSGGPPDRHVHNVLLGLLALVLVLGELGLGVKCGAVDAQLLDDLIARLKGGEGDSNHEDKGGRLNRDSP